MRSRLYFFAAVFYLCFAYVLCAHLEAITGKTALSIALSSFKPALLLFLITVAGFFLVLGFIHLAAYCARERRRLKNIRRMRG